MGLKRKVPKQKGKKLKRRRALDAEDQIAQLEKKAAKKHKKLEYSYQIQEARKRREALKEAGTIHVDEVLRAISSKGQPRSGTKKPVNTPVSSLLSSLGVQHEKVEDFDWSSASSEEWDQESGTPSDNESDASEMDSSGGSHIDDALEEDDILSESESSGEEVVGTELHKKISFPESTEFTQESQDLLGSLMTGKDVVYGIESFHDKTMARSIYTMLSAHTLSHMLHKVGRVERNNKRLSKNPEAEDVRDQGPNRPRLLWLAPFRSNAFEVIRYWLAFLNSEESSGNTASFLDEYKDQDIRNEHARNWEDWRRELFKGHYDDSSYDDFVIGVSFHHGRMRLQFPKNSQGLCGVDAIVASPLALSRIAAADHKSIRVREKFGNVDQEDQQPPVMDFLSGIEILVVDRVDAMCMQNWTNCCDVVSSVNQQAVATITADINRIEEKFLSPDSAKAERQTILVCGSSIMSEYESLGLRRDKERVIESNIIYSGISLKRALKQKIKQQLFVKVPTGSSLDYFKNSFWKEVGNDVKQLIIVISSSVTDISPLVEFLDDEGISKSCCLSEDTLSDIGGKRRKQIKATLKAFREGENRILVVTERLLWYQRIRITSGRHVLFYGCPRTDSVYADIIADVVDPLRSTCTCIYSEEEARALERVVGTGEIDKLIDPTCDRKITVFTP